MAMRAGKKFRLMVLDGARDGRGQGGESPLTQVEAAERQLNRQSSAPVASPHIFDASSPTGSEAALLIARCSSSLVTCNCHPLEIVLYLYR